MRNYQNSIRKEGVTETSAEEESSRKERRKRDRERPETKLFKYIK